MRHYQVDPDLEASRISKLWPVLPDYAWWINARAHISLPELAQRSSTAASRLIGQPQF